MVWIEGFENMFGAFDENDTQLSGIDPAEIRFQTAMHKIGECASKLDSCGAASDDGDSHQTPAFC